MNETELELRNRAIDALQKGDLQESELLFRKLLGSSELGGQALAGIGMIRLTQGDFAGSSELFQSALNRGPDADAFYGLGVLAERAGNNQQAFDYQLRALQVNPGHAGARGRLEALQKLAFSTSPPAPPVAPAAAPPANYDPSAFEVILTGDEKQARDQAFAFLQRFRMKRRPRLSAYFGSILAIIGLLALIVTEIGLINYRSASRRTMFEPTQTTPTVAPPRLPHIKGNH